MKKTSKLLQQSFRLQSLVTALNFLTVNNLRGLKWATLPFTNN